MLQSVLYAPLMANASQADLFGKAELFHGIGLKKICKNLEIGMKSTQITWMQNCETMTCVPGSTEASGMLFVNICNYQWSVKTSP